MGATQSCDAAVPAAVLARPSTDQVVVDMDDYIAALLDASNEGARPKLALPPRNPADHSTAHIALDMDDYISNDLDTD